MFEYKIYEIFLHGTIQYQNYKNEYCRLLGKYSQTQNFFVKKVSKSLKASYLDRRKSF